MKRSTGRFYWPSHLCQKWIFDRSITRAIIALIRGEMMKPQPVSQPFDPASIPWIPLGPGESFKPLHFSERGRALLLRLEPGAMVSLHRHFGEVHAFNV